MFDSETRTPWLGAFFALSEAFVVPAFFSLSGYYAERSLERHAPWPFVRRKLVRLGVPLLTMIAAVNPVYFYVGYHLHSGAEDVGLISFPHFYTSHWLGLKRPPAFRWPGLSFPLFTKIHLWFVESLLVYSIAFALFPRPQGRDAQQVLEPGSTETVSVGGDSVADEDTTATATSTRSTAAAAAASLAGTSSTDGAAPLENGAVSTTVLVTGHSAAEADQLERNATWRFCRLALGYTAVVGLGTFAVRVFYPIDATLRLRLTYVKPARQVQYIGAFALGVWAARRRVALVRALALERRINSLASLGIGTMLVGLSCVQHRMAFKNRLRGGLTLDSFTYALVETAISFLVTTGTVSLAARSGAKTTAEPRGWLRTQLGASVYGVYIMHYFVVTAVQTVLERIRPQAPATAKWAIVTCASLPLSFGVSMALRAVPGMKQLL